MTGRHAGPCTDQGSATDRQRVTIRAFFVSLGLAGPEMYLIMLASGSDSGRLEDLSELEADRVLDVCYEAGRELRLP